MASFCGRAISGDRFSTKAALETPLIPGNGMASQDQLFHAWLTFELARYLQLLLYGGILNSWDCFLTYTDTRTC